MKYLIQTHGLKWQLFPFNVHEDIAKTTGISVMNFESLPSFFPLDLLVRITVIALQCYYVRKPDDNITQREL